MTRDDGDPIEVTVRFSGHLADEIMGLAEVQTGGDAGAMVHDIVEYHLTPASSRMLMNTQQETKE